MLYILDSRILEPVASDLCPSSSDSSSVGGVERWRDCLCSTLAFVDCGSLCSPLLLAWLRNSDVILQSHPGCIPEKHLLFTLSGLLCSLFSTDIFNHFVGFLQEAKHHLSQCQCVIQPTTEKNLFNLKIPFSLGVNESSTYES